MKNLYTIGLLLLIVSSIAMAAPVGSQFSYQGKLNDNGSPANGTYDFRMMLLSAETGGIVVSQIIIDDVSVVNGLFTVELDFGDAPFNGEDNFLQIQVREGSSVGSYTTLSPRQRINAVPYAIQSEFVENGSSPWQDYFLGGIRYVDKVSIGSGNSLSKLTISVDLGEQPLRAQIRGQTKLLVTSSGGTAIGGNATAPNDGLRVEGESNFNSDVKIGNTGTATSSALTVDADAGQSPIRFKVAGGTKMILQANGGTSFGANASAPDNGIRVEGITRLMGNTELNGDLKQSLNNNGALKASLAFICEDIPSITKSYNGVNNGSFSINRVMIFRCEISFPFSLADRYISATDISSGTTSLGGSREYKYLPHCHIKETDNTKLLCQSRNLSFIPNTFGPGRTHILVF